MSSGRAALEREADILAEALDQVRSRLPNGWSLQARGDVALFGPDAVAELCAPGGERASLVIEVKRNPVTKDLVSVLDQLNTYIAGGLVGTSPRSRKDQAAPMVVARYFSPPLQAWMTEREVPYADATGNVRLALGRPALFLRDVGATKDPWRGPGRPKGNLTGEPAARVVRALVDFAPPYSVPRIIDLAGASSGATYRVVEFLADQLLLTREARGPVVGVEWRALIERWAKDYGFSRTNSVTSYLAPRGLPDLLARLPKGAPAPGLRYAVTGTFAVQRWASYAPARNAMIYADNPALLAQHVGLREVETGANVLVAKSAYDVVYERTSVVDGVFMVAPSQAAVDLMTGPGRNPAEAEELLAWMEANEGEWRG